MIPRYTPPRIAEIFSEESRLTRWLEVELLAVEGWELSGRVPAGTAAALRATVRVDPGRVAELEAEQGHDLAAFVSAVQETAGDAGRFLHLGLTSSDVVDTALATQLRDAAAVLDEDAQGLERALAELAVAHRLTLMPGRTHGVHAEPLSLGVKLANHWDEVGRSRRRLGDAAIEVAVGQHQRRGRHPQLGELRGRGARLHPARARRRPRLHPGARPRPPRRARHRDGDPRRR